MATPIKFVYAITSSPSSQQPTQHTHENVCASKYHLLGQLLVLADHHPGHDVSVPGDELGGAVNDEVRSEHDRLLEARRHHGAVHFHQSVLRRQKYCGGIGGVSVVAVKGGVGVTRVRVGWIDVARVAVKVAPKHRCSA